MVSFEGKNTFRYGVDTKISKVVFRYYKGKVQHYWKDTNTFKVGDILSINGRYYNIDTLGVHIINSFDELLIKIKMTSIEYIRNKKINSLYEN